MGENKGAVMNESHDSLHGEWLMVKRKQRNSRTSKTSKNTKDSKSNNIRGNNDKKAKSYAKGDTSKTHARSKKAATNNGAQMNNKKENRPTPLGLKNKRMRQDLGVTMRHFVKNAPSEVGQNGIGSKDPIKPKPKEANAEINNKPSLFHLKVNAKASNKPSVFDLAFNAQSSVKMKALSNNRFLLLHEDDSDTMDMAKIAIEAPQQIPSQDMVPKT